MIRRCRSNTVVASTVQADWAANDGVQTPFAATAEQRGEADHSQLQQTQQNAAQIRTHVLPMLAIAGTTDLSIQECVRKFKILCGINGRRLVNVWKMLSFRFSFFSTLMLSCLLTLMLITVFLYENYWSFWNNTIRYDTKRKCLHTLQNWRVAMLTNFVFQRGKRPEN